MERRSRAQARHRKTVAIPQRLLHQIIENLAFVVLTSSILLTMGAIGIVGKHAPLASASGNGGTATPESYRNGVIQATCGMAGLPAYPAIEHRIHLRSQSPTDIIAAARQSPLFRVDRSGKGDYLKDISQLGRPQLVQALHGVGKIVAPDFYVIPIFDGAGATVAAAELELDANHTTIDVVAIVTYKQPYAHDMLTHTSAEAAARSVQAQRRIGWRASAQPRLVYIPFDPVARQTGRIVWTAGGGSPAEPVWAVPGTDGRDYIVGIDDHVYAMSDLPLAGA
jgi:hypothetical protein